MKIILTCGIVAATALIVAPAMQAQQPVTMALSTVGDPGNAADTTVMNDSTTGYGSVGYTFNIGTYDVTLTQYTAFLNAVAQTDTFGLYNENLDGRESYIGGCISRTGAAGSYSYAVMGDGQRPVTFVSWLDAARFCNWMNNGEPQTHVENASTTESGAYALDADTTVGLEVAEPTATWRLPTEDEWYKAAYYDPTLNDGQGGYWAYATRSNAAPGNSWADRTLANEANYYSFSGGYTLPGTSGYLTPVGAFTDSESYYGTYDQAGDVQNWNDAVLYEFCRGIHGDDWSNTMFNLSSSRRSFGPPTSMGEVYETGFRVANVPEPSSIMLTGLGGILAVALRRKPSR